MTVPTILLLGATGQVGTELAPRLAALGAVHAPSRAQVDLTDAAALRRHVRAVGPAVIVNAAAFTAVEQAERAPDEAFAINAAAPGVLAEEAARLGSALVHYSTDYVFDGAQSTSYDEAAVPRPINVYGASKLAGERAVLDRCPRALVVRTSWVYGAHGHNFVRTMLRLAPDATADRPLRVVDDQWGVPTSSAFVAECTVTMLRTLIGAAPDGAPGPWGICHVVAGGTTSWHGFAQAIFAGAAARGLRMPPLEPTSTRAHGSSVRRPVSAVLDTARLTAVFGVRPASWTTHLDRALDILIGPTTASDVAAAHSPPAARPTLVPER